MKRRFAAPRWIAILTLALITLMTSCGKSGGGGTPAEANLAVTITPASGSTQAPAVGPFTLNVKITSTLPSKGVTISVIAAPDGTSTAYFSKAENSTKSSNDYTITNTPVGKVCVVTVTVTSLNTSTNTWTGSYRYSAK